MKWIEKGDWDGFFGLGLNNLINFLLIISLSQSVLGFSTEMIATRVLPGMAMGLLFGNLFYAWQARSHAKRIGRDDVCALPYGINLLPIFFYTFYVMLPAQQIALSNGASDDEANHLAWIAGILACVGSGLIELIGSFFVHLIRRVAPRAALLSALGVIGIFFIAADYAFRAYEFPLVGLPTLFLTLYFYYGGDKVRFGIPGGLIVLSAGILIAWLCHGLGFKSPIGGIPDSSLDFGLYLPWFFGFEAFLSVGQMASFAAVIVPMGLINVVGSMQALESASASGDDFPPKSSLAVNGLGTIVAGSLGSPYPTTLYIGHPGWKAIGARAGYSLINGVLMAALCLTGSLGFLSEYVPIEAGMAILIWIGITIGAQAFQAVPRAHAPAVIVGMIPGIGAFCALVVKRVLGALGFGEADQPYSFELLANLTAKGNLFAEGVFVLEQGWLYASILLCGFMVALIERKFSVAIGWLIASAGLSTLGVIHHFKVLSSDITTSIGPAWEWVFGYLVAALSMVAVKFVMTHKSDGENS
ncbi:MAG: NCS2 family permease [Verrucomicrobiota bacterium]|nr:NCS2 family permease [Verrucomicrobiota bacterium]